MMINIYQSIIFIDVDTQRQDLALLLNSRTQH